MFIHSTAEIENDVHIGEGASVWHHCHVRRGASIGSGVSLGKAVYVDVDVSIGSRTRVQNGVSLYKGVEVGEQCFIGPHVVFTNDLKPRVGKRDWVLEQTLIRSGASIGAGAVLRCGIEVGAFAMIAAGAIVTRSVGAFSLVKGLPAREKSLICACGSSTLTTLAKEPLLSCCLEMLDEVTINLARSEWRHLTQINFDEQS